MSPQLVTLIIALVQEAITLEPAIASELQSIFTSQNPTPADWEALRQNILAKTYNDYVPASALPAASAVSVLPPAVTPPAQSNAPITQASASVEAEKAAQPQKPANLSPYLPNGKPNPAFNHLAPPVKAIA